MLPRLFKSSFVPQSVADETQWSRALIGAELVPHLREHHWIQVDLVPADTLRAAVVSLFRSDYRRRRGAKAGSPKPEVVIVGGRVIAWTPKERLTYKIPDLEVVLLAQSARAVAILDDRKALRAALDLGVTTATTREVVEIMVQRGLVADVESLIEQMRETGYHPTVRSANVWDGTP